ncbi:hypothetical protein FNF07_27065 [Trinickia caryophylli]|uniref:hypothetical protein n=1 Tax=Trinickia caryophylli TaxID=28094 RepID=UPI00117C4EBC|nr:hypothetical protein [Trinickia caryophylli]TRX14881.1 hypothetical protein FNF07_27065 [Trinickia caryophylli]
MPSASLFDRRSSSDTAAITAPAHAQKVTAAEQFEKLAAEECAAKPAQLNRRLHPARRMIGGDAAFDHALRVPGLEDADGQEVHDAHGQRQQQKSCEPSRDAGGRQKGHGEEDSDAHLHEPLHR